MSFRDRFKEPLLNPTWEQIVELDPIMGFSVYLSSRVHVLTGFSDEIEGCLEHGFSKEILDGRLIGRASSLMWLWILGAYEVVRTMCQAEKCFSPGALQDLRRLKKRLAAVRMPAAKMEKPRSESPVSSDRSPDGWDNQRRDLLINDPNEAAVFARELLSEFDRVLCSLKASDILCRHEESYRGNV